MNIRTLLDRIFLLVLIVSLGVVLSAAAVALGVPIADPIVGLVITALILQITWQSWNTVRGRARR